MGDMSAESGADQPALPSNELSARWPLWLGVFLFCFAGASIAYFTTKPLYRSDAIFEFVPTRMATPENPAHSAADLDFVDGQAYIARSDRVVGAAMNNRAWKALGRGVTPRSAIAFAERVETQAIPGGVLRISFYDADAKAAQVGAGTLGDEYASLHLYRDQNRLDVLYKRLSLFASDITRLDTQIIEVAEEFRGADLAVLQTFKTQEALRLEREMHDAETAALILTTQQSSASTRPAAKALAARYEAALAQTQRVGGAILKLRDLEKKRQAAEQEKLNIVHRINELSIEGGPRMASVQSAHLPLAPAIDHRIRNAAWSALVSLVGFFILRRIWRAWRERRRVVLARTAFPLIITHTPRPKPVIPIEAGAAGGM
jgi:hypothetical protein